MPDGIDARHRHVTHRERDATRQEISRRGLDAVEVGMPIGRKFERRFAAAVRSWEMEEPDAGEQGDQTEITGRQLRHAVRRADLPAVAEVRRLLREHLRLWGVPALVDTAELLTTELVTNALQHTGDGAVVVVGLEPGASAMRLRVEVH